MKLLRTSTYEEMEQKALNHDSIVKDLNARIAELEKQSKEQTIEGTHQITADNESMKTEIAGLKEKVSTHEKTIAAKDDELVATKAKLETAEKQVGELTTKLANTEKENKEAIEKLTNTHNEAVKQLTDNFKTELSNAEKSSNRKAALILGTQGIDSTKLKEVEEKKNDNKFIVVVHNS